MTLCRPSPVTPALVRRPVSSPPGGPVCSGVPTVPRSKVSSLDRIVAWRPDGRGVGDRGDRVVLERGDHCILFPRGVVVGMESFDERVEILYIIRLKSYAAGDTFFHDRCLIIVEMSSSTIECRVDGIVLCGLERLYTHPSLERSCPRLVLPLLHLGTSVPLRSHHPSPPLVALLPLRTSDSTLVQVESDQLQ